MKKSIPHCLQIFIGQVAVVVYCLQEHSIYSIYSVNIFARIIYNNAQYTKYYNISLNRTHRNNYKFKAEIKYWLSFVLQKELFGGGAESAQPDGLGNRKMSNGSTGSNTKHKWLKAFKSLKTTPTTPPPNEKLVFLYIRMHLNVFSYTFRKVNV